MEKKVDLLLHGRNGSTQDVEAKRWDLDGLFREQDKLKKVKDILLADNSQETADTQRKVQKVVMEMCSTGQPVTCIWTTLAAAAVARNTDRRTLAEHIIDGRELDGRLYRLVTIKFTVGGGAQAAAGTY